MPQVMMVKSSDSDHAGDERLDGQRRFRLPHEDAGGNVERFGSANAHDLLHRYGHRAHDVLHDAPR